MFHHTITNRLGFHVYYRIANYRCNNFCIFRYRGKKKCSLTKHTIDISFEQISSLHRLDEERDQDEYAPNFMKQLSPMKDPKML